MVIVKIRVEVQISGASRRLLNILGEYALRINKERKEMNMELLPYAKVTATGIKTSESVKKY